MWICYSQIPKHTHIHTDAKNFFLSMFLVCLMCATHKFEFNVSWLHDDGKQKKKFFSTFVIKRIRSLSFSVCVCLCSVDMQHKGRQTASQPASTILQYYNNIPILILVPFSNFFITCIFILYVACLYVFLVYM